MINLEIHPFPYKLSVNRVNEEEGRFGNYEKLIYCLVHNPLSYKNKTPSRFMFVSSLKLKMFNVLQFLWQSLKRFQPTACWFVPKKSEPMLLGIGKFVSCVVFMVHKHRIYFFTLRKADELKDE